MPLSMPRSQKQSDILSPRIDIAPDNALVDQVIRIRLSGIMPNHAVTLRAQMQDNLGGAWTSHASFRANATGAVDVSSQPPLSGTYQGTDPMGLFWSMATQDELKGATFVLETPNAPTITTLSAEVGSQIVASATLERTHLAHGVRVVPVREQGLVGTLFLPESNAPRPAIIDLGGSVGGLRESRAALLASHGYAALALAYFGIERLLQDFVRIPLEYFETAIKWLQATEGVASDRLAVIGESRGGELALLLGATFTQVRAVVGVVPSGVMLTGFRRGFAGLVEMLIRRPAAWTHRGAPLPGLVPGRSVSSFVSYGWKRLMRDPIAGAPFFLEAMKDTDAVERAAIPVERINGPVLLLSAQDDQFSASPVLSEVAIERLARSKHPYPYEHICYQGAGHVFGMPYQPATVTRAHHPVAGGIYLAGGNPRDNAFAAADSWNRILRFLERSLGT